MVAEKCMSNTYRFNHVILNPILPILLSALIFIISAFCYTTPNVTIVIVMLILVALCLMPFVCFFDSKKTYLESEVKIVAFPFSRTVTSLIILTSAVEYYLLGVPFLGGGVYAEFGFPFLHHISVMSWIFIITYRGFRIKLIRIVVFIFAFINPVLMINRDLLLLTCFVFMLYLLCKNMVSFKVLVLIGAFFLFIFGLIGEYRSPGVIYTIDLPFSFEYTNLSPVLAWLFIYFTSSSFNMYHNINSLQLDLYAQNINVFPEAYYWSSYFNSMIVFPVILVFFYFLLSISRGGIFKKGIDEAFLLLHWYFFYQAYTSLFAVKIFTSHTLFVMLFFMFTSLTHKILLKRHG